MKNKSVPFLFLALSACATLPPEIPGASECRANYLGLDEQVEKAGVRDGGAHPVPGFPYLRSDRFLASFNVEASEGDRFGAWVERMRKLDLQARTVELRNLGWPSPDEEIRHLGACGLRWLTRDLADPQRRAQLRDAVAVPDDYSTWRRVLGLYPLAVPFLNIGIKGFNKDVKADYARPVAELQAPGTLTLWNVEGARPSTADAAKIAAAAWRDPLGIPDISESDWWKLGMAHAPAWLVEDAGRVDQIGAPVLKDGKPAFDESRPVTYFLPAYTRFGDKVLPQLVYVVWFPERPKSAGYSYAGTLDGVVWRVTLDTDGQPLLYDTIHACGCYHYYFPAKPLARKPQGGFWQEPVLFPQDAPTVPFAIRVQSGTHYVRRLVPMTTVNPEEIHGYSTRAYNELLTLPDRKGTRSLFCEDGLACGTERFERFWLWPAGIVSAGAMRQWGRHATSFVGRSHFDDPDMLDRLFQSGQSRLK